MGNVFWILRKMFFINDAVEKVKFIDLFCGMGNFHYSSGLGMRMHVVVNITYVDSCVSMIFGSRFDSRRLIFFRNEWFRV